MTYFLNGPMTRCTVLKLFGKYIKEGAGITLSKPQRMKNYHFDHPDVQKKLEERWNGDINWNEKVVAPSDLMESNKLVLVETTY